MPPELGLEERYALWVEAMKAEGIIKHRSLEEMRERFEPVELFEHSFTVLDTETKTFAVEFAVEHIQ